MPIGQRNLRYSFYQSKSFFMRLGRFVGKMPAAMLLLAENHVAAFHTQCQNRSHKLIYQQPKWQSRPPYENNFPHVGPTLALAVGAELSPSVLAEWTTPMSPSHSSF